MRIFRLLLLTVALAVPGCGGSTPTEPEAPSLALLLPQSVQARIVACDTCPDPIIVTAEFTVAVQSLDSRGGTVASVETTVVNQSRSVMMVRNVRPNSDFGYPDTSLPPGGRLELAAGAAFSLPPPRDEIVVRVLVRMSDGREASATAPVVVVA